jgi:hypothetical protein
MAKVPASFIKNYVAQHGTNNRFARATAAPPSPQNAPASPAQNTPAPKPKRSRVPKRKIPRVPARKRPGFFRKAMGAVAGEVLKNTGYLGKHVVRSISEDGMGGLGGTPVNNASSGAVAGLGSGHDEPGVKKCRKAPMLSYKMFKRTKNVQK